MGPLVNSQHDEQHPSISGDGLELYFMSRRPGGVGDWDIWVARRETTSEPWRELVNVGPTVNGTGEDWAPCISADGLELYFEANRPGGQGGTDILVASRKTTDGPWGDAVNLGPVVNTASRDGGPSISADGLELHFKSNRPGGHGYEDIWVSSRPAKDAPWGTPVNLGSPVTGADVDRAPSTSVDGLVLFFASDRLNGARGWDWDIWLARRDTKNAAWGEPVNLGPRVNTIYNDDAPSVSADSRTLYFSDYYYAGLVRPGGYGGADIWQAPIVPILDFNGDGFVEIGDLVMLIESWGTPDSLCDVGPMPWGDGTVNEADLEVLMSHWGQEAYDPALLMYWKLDESEGGIAFDSAADRDGILNGDPVWQPAGGKVGGALLLDGVDDCVATDFVCDPSEGPFSVLAWVKGGAPGQVILSQVGGANWLVASSADGTLMTDLKSSGRQSKTLASTALVTDNAWHCVGLSWDGETRILYVDNAEVARDTQANLPSSTGGLHIGTDSTLAPGTFWSGLIDDVRIYCRAVTP